MADDADEPPLVDAADGPFPVSVLTLPSETVDVPSMISLLPGVQLSTTSSCVMREIRGMLFASHEK